MEGGPPIKDRNGRKSQSVKLQSIERPSQSSRETLNVNFANRWSNTPVNTNKESGKPTGIWTGMAKADGSTPRHRMADDR